MSGRAAWSAIAAITGQALADVEVTFRLATAAHPDKHHPAPEDVASLVDRLKTRLGLAPAVDDVLARTLSTDLESLLGDANITVGTLAAWDDLLRHTPEHVPTIDRAPVALPRLPDHQAYLWRTLLDFEDLGQPWVLVGGQMTLLHCLQNGVTLTRPTDDGDIIVGVWTRRDALARTTRFLRERGFAEEKTSDGYGYRFARGEKPHVTVIDVLLPEGLERQDNSPTTVSGCPGLSAPGANQALTRAERVPIVLNGYAGYVRRPTLLGAIVAKAHAYVVDGRDEVRHAADLVTLAEIGLRNPRTTLEAARHGDRKPVRRFLRGKTAQDSTFRQASDPEAVFSFLQRLADPAG